MLTKKIIHLKRDTKFISRQKKTKKKKKKLSLGHDPKRIEIPDSQFENLSYLYQTSIKSCFIL